MHNTIDYSKYPEAEKRRKALQDIQNWIGIKKFDEQSKAIRSCQPPMTWPQFMLMCAIGGIEGYPVRVWAEDCGIELPPEEKKGDEPTETK